MAINPKRQKKYARVAEGKKLRTKLRQARRRKKSAAKPKFMENNFTEKDLKDIKIAEATVAHYVQMPEKLQPQSLPGFMASVTKLKGFFQREVSEISPRVKMTPDQVIEYYRRDLDARILFNDLDLHLRIMTNEAPAITKETAYALVKKIWMPKKKG